ncbi:MAG: hypothetical protein V5A68_07410, partial [Candidatus Thermoplasmatota archaeon]
MKISWLDNAVLIYGPRKAGTTLLDNLLDGNSELFVHPRELKIKHFINSIWPAQPNATENFVKMS